MPDEMSSQLKGFQQQGQDALTGLSNLNSAFSGINSADQVRARYGIKDTASMFDPLFKTLASNRARRMQGGVMRAGRSASPEMSFSNIEGDYENSLQGLLGNKAQAEQGQSQFVANLLHGAQSGQDQFGLQKFVSTGNLARGMFGDQLGAEESMWNRRPANFGDIFGTFFGTGAKVVGSALGAPKTTNNFFGQKG